MELKKKARRLDHFDRVDSPMADAENEQEDAEGLASSYDLIVDGTGLTESIVAAAAARCGKTVLHVDPNPYYGQSSAGFTLEEFIAWCKTNSDADACSSSISGSSDADAESGVSLLPRASLTRVVELYEPSASECAQPVLAVARHAVPKKYHPACIGYVMQRTSASALPVAWSPLSVHPAFAGYVPDHRMTAARALDQSRRFTIDLSGSMVLGAGRAVQVRSLSHTHTRLPPLSLTYTPPPGRRRRAGT